MSYSLLSDYPRRPHFEFYRSHPSPFYSVTFELDATRLRERLADERAPVYAGLCWHFHRALLTLPAFRVRLLGDELVLHDRLRMGLTVPAPRRTFTFATFEWEPDWAAFAGSARGVLERASESVDLTGGSEPDFAYYTALPRIPFSAFTHVTLTDPTAGQPGTAFGKLAERQGRFAVPVGVQVNHLFIDGGDLGDIYEAAQASFAAPG
ncbi:MAG: CatA-like O-acetyltransferase [Thermoanaerobaculia bacterium]